MKTALLRSPQYLRSFSAAGRYLLDRLGDLLGPPTCPGCDDPCESDSPFCAACTPSFRRVQPAHAPSTPAGPVVYSAFELEGALQKALHRLKYAERSDLARPLGLLLERSLLAHAPPDWSAVSRPAAGKDQRDERPAFGQAQPAAGKDQRDERPAFGQARPVVVPVPLHPKKLAERGYNQSALLAGYVARALQTQLDTTTLRRDRATDAQARLDRQARLRNVAGAFGVQHPKRIEGRSVLLVDDVMTTGSTLQACAAALRTAGAEAIGFVTLARAAQG